MGKILKKIDGREEKTESLVLVKKNRKEYGKKSHRKDHELRE